MAILIVNHNTYELPDGASIMEPCEKEGLSFNCNTGVCGACQVNVLEGAENLSDLLPEEEDLGLDLSTRLACLCTIKSGTVKIAF